MSVVACKINEQNIEVSADSICVRGYTQEKNVGTKPTKLFEINGFIIGGAGLASETGMMQVFAETHKPASPSESDLLAFLSEFADWKKKRTDKYILENEYILAFSGHAFRINEFSIREIDSYDAIGAGMDFALSALYLGNNTIKAVEAACELSVYCEKPIKTLTIPR